MIGVKCIVAIVERGKAKNIVDAAKKAGATGATIFYGRGTGDSEVKKFLKVNIESSKEIILVLSEKKDIKRIVTGMVEAGNLLEPGRGIIFTVPIDNLIGLHHREDFEKFGE